ncbi:MAG: hypothetical protein IPG45_14525 [Deltaproteobacteria bacterium]|nr:hypothetical protein [Deltaproteobacteria bacterium]
MRRLGQLLGGLSLGLAMAACSDSGNNDPVDAGIVADLGTNADGGVQNDTGVAQPDVGFNPDATVGPDSGSCLVETPPDPTPDPACTADWLTVVKGDLVRAGGGPIEDARAQLCLRTPNDVLRCLRPAATCADGHFEIAVPEEARCVAHGALRMLLPTGGYATTYCELPVVNPPVVTLPSALRLYATNPVANLPPAGDLTASRDINFEGGLVASLIPNDTYVEYGDLAARKIAAADPVPCFLEGQPAPDGLWAFSPEGDIVGDGAPLVIPNTTGLAAGSMVRLYVLGGLDCTLSDGTLVPESEWREYGNAQVSADGTVIEGARLPCLTWFGYRAQ